MAVIDASVYITLINAYEKDHTSSWAWFESAQAEQEPILAPVILLAEIAAALSRGIRDKNLAHRMVGQLKRSGVIDLIPVTLTMAERAAAIAADHQIRGCDAIYVALADQLSDCLVTLDKQQLERATSIVTVHKP